MRLRLLLQVMLLSISVWVKTNSPLSSKKSTKSTEHALASFLISKHRIVSRDYRFLSSRNFTNAAFSIDWSETNTKTSYFNLILLLAGDVEVNPGPSNQSTEEEKKCSHCSKEFARSDLLQRHIQTIHGDQSVSCDSCGERFNRKDNMLRHRKRMHIPYADRVTKNTPPSKRQKFTPHSMKLIDPTTSYNPTSISELRFPIEDDHIQVTQKKQAFGGMARKYVCKIKGDVRDHIFALDKITTSAVVLIKDMLASFRGVKLSICLHVEFFKALEPEKLKYAYFWSSQKTFLIQSEAIENDVRRCYPKMIEGVEKFISEGSGWIIRKVHVADVNLVAYEPLSGRCFTELPTKLKQKHAILNIRNNDDKCFLWCVIAKLYSVSSHRNDVSKYRSHESKIICDDLEFPMTLRQIPKFETLNDVSINVYGFEGLIFPLFISEKDNVDKNRHIDLLLYDDHYFLVTNLDRLLSSVKGGNRKKYFCHRCLVPQYSEQGLQDHLSHCVKNDPTRILSPKEDYLMFTNVQNQLRQPIVIYADFECFVAPVDNESFGCCNVYQKHIPASYGILQVKNCCGHPEDAHIEIYRGQNPVKSFLNKLIEISLEHNEDIDAHGKPNLTNEDESKFYGSTACHICQKELNGDMVRDHCHVCGKFRGAAHSNCNLQYQTNRNIVVVFHNLRRYDGHLIMQDIGGVCKSVGLRLYCIAKSMEDYLGFTLTPIKNCIESCIENEESDNESEAYKVKHKRNKWRIRFIDSYQFLSQSLDALVRSMNVSDFYYLKQEFDDVNLLTRKGVFPYDLMQDETFFQLQSLPSKTEFFNKLTNSHISDDDYRHAESVWRHFGMHHMGDYHDLYLKCDVLSLADVMERFRCLCLTNYGLDPVHYLTLPSFAFDSCFKITGVKLQTISDPDMYSFFERGIRGGISVISKRHAQANNRYMSSFDPTKSESYILYVDMNNLYGTAMSKYLPTDSFHFMSHAEILKTDFLRVPEDSDIGYILEVDLDYPVEFHDSHSDYPLAPEKMSVSDSDLSPYCKQLKDDLNVKTGFPKLIPNLKGKKKYVLHYINLQLYCRLGLKLTHIYNVVSFKQSPWLKFYININTNLRRQATSDFAKDLFKLMNNAVFGKTMENVRAYKEIKLATTSAQFKRLADSPRFKRFSIFSEDLVGVAMLRKVTCLNKPIYVGFAVLDLSKVFMFEYHYDHIIPAYKKDVKLLFTDTDSLMYHIYTEDIYKDMLKNANLYDTSDYPLDHFLHSKDNCKKLGKMKDEAKGLIIEEFVGLRAKMYAFRVTGAETKKAKGIKKQVVRDDMSFDDYFEALFSRKVFHHEMNLIKTTQHQIYSVTQEKKSLSPFDDKRYILDDGITTLAYGHYAINHRLEAMSLSDDDGL